MASSIETHTTVDFADTSLVLECADCGSASIITPKATEPPRGDLVCRCGKELFKDQDHLIRALGCFRMLARAETPGRIRIRVPLK